MAQFLEKYGSYYKVIVMTEFNSEGSLLLGHKRKNKSDILSHIYLLNSP